MNKLSVVFPSVCITYLLLAIILNTPISLHPTSSLSYPDDPLLNTWIMSWVAKQVVNNPLDLFQANIFYPHKYTLAYSEHIIGNQLFFMPVYYISRNPVLAYNIVYLATFLLAALGTYLLVMDLGYGAKAAFIAGIIYGFNPAKYSQIMHIQLLSNHWMPFVFLFMHRFYRNPNKKNTWLIILFFNLQILCSYYHAVFAFLSIIIFMLFFSTKILKHVKIKNLAVMFFPPLLLTFLIQVPLTVPYYKVKNEQGLYRNLKDSELYSASLNNYLIAPSYNRIYGKFFVKKRKWEGTLFPGIITVILFTYGILRGESSSWKRFYFILVIFCFIMSFGPYFHLTKYNLSIPLPYKFFYHILPGVKALRAPNRFALLMMLGVAVLAAIGSKQLFKTKWIYTPVRKIFVFMILTLLIVSEYYSAPLPKKTFLVGNQIPIVYQWLATQPSDLVVLELPFQKKFVKGSPLATYYSIYHGKRIINGYSGFFPADFRIYNHYASKLPADEALQFFRNLKLNLILDHEPYQIKNVSSWKSLTLIKNFNGCKVYQLE